MSKKRKNKALSKHKSIPEKTVSAQLTQITQHHFAGPVPHPDILKKYDEIVPGAAERILTMAEEDAKHQRNMEMAALRFKSEEAKRGQNYGLAIGVLAFATSIIALCLGSEKTAIALGGTTVVGLVTVFVTGRLLLRKQESLSTPHT